MRRMTLGEGRKLVTAVRTPNPSLSEPRPDASSEVLRLVEAPFRDVADAHERLAALEALLYESGDRRAVFLTIYARVTAEVDAGLEHGEFTDPAWVADYLVTFADHYRRAFSPSNAAGSRWYPTPGGSRSKRLSAGNRS